MFVLTCTNLIKYIVIFIIFQQKMSVKSNLTLVIVAIILSVAMWMAPETISVQSNSKRLLALTTYNTNPTRSPNIAKYCQGTSREDLITKDQKSTSEQYKNQLASQFKTNGNALFNKIVDKKMSDAISDIQSDATAYGLFVGFFALGLIILLWSWSFLICCCCCPGCCPSKCCQKNQNQQYTKCELYWPSVFLILLLLLVIITTAIGLARAATFKTGIKNLTCAASMMFDDIVNGNVTSDGQFFFIGVGQLSTQIGYLGGNMTTINGNLTDLKNNVTAMVTSSSTAAANVRLVPANAAADGNAVIQYTTPFDATYASGNPKINSQFPTILGSSGNGGFIGALYTALDQLHTTLNDIQTSSTAFTGSSAGFSSAIASMQTSLNDFKTSLNDLDNSLADGLGVFDMPKQYGTMAIQLFFGAVLGLSVLALLGVVMMTFCDKYKCRYLMYISCVILFFFALLGFLIAVIFSIIVPILYWGCDWLSITFSSSANFHTNITPLISSSTTRNYIAPCLKGGNGDLMAVVAPGTFTTLNNLRDSLKNTSSFNSTAQVSALTAAMNAVDTAITNFADGVTPDIIDGAAIGTLISVANRNGIGGCAILNTDSFVMSTANTSFTSCAVPSGTITTNGNCASGALATPGSCVGCIDTSLITNAYYVGQPRGQWQTDLISKYTSGTNTCAAPFTVYFGNVWDNYYYVKINNAAPNNFLSIKGRWTSPAKTDVNSILAALPLLGGNMTNISGNLTSTVDSITNAKYGLVAGLNCLLIGEDIETLVSSICISNFNTLYLTRLVAGISSFGILFALCCIVCSGVRHFKHNQRKDKISPNFTGGKNSFEDTDAAFRP